MIVSMLLNNLFWNRKSDEKNYKKLSNIISVICIVLIIYRLYFF